MPVKFKGALSLSGSGSILKRRNGLESVWQWFKPFDFHWVFYKIDNLVGTDSSPFILVTGNLITESNVFSWLRLNSCVLKCKCDVGLKFN